MTGYIKKLHAAIFNIQTGCGKTHLVLELIENYYNKHFDYIITICPTLRENSTYHTKEWIKSDDKIWLMFYKSLSMDSKVIRIITIPRGTIYH